MRLSSSSLLCLQLSGAASLPAVPLAAAPSVGADAATVWRSLTPAQTVPVCLLYLTTSRHCMPVVGPLTPDSPEPTAAMIAIQLSHWRSLTRRLQVSNPKYSNLPGPVKGRMLNWPTTRPCSLEGAHRIFGGFCWGGNTPTPIAFFRRTKRALVPCIVH